MKIIVFEYFYNGQNEFITDYTSMTYMYVKKDADGTTPSIVILKV